MDPYLGKIICTWVSFAGALLVAVAAIGTVQFSSVIEKEKNLKIDELSEGQQKLLEGNKKLQEDNKKLVQMNTKSGAIESGNVMARTLRVYCGSNLCDLNSAILNDEILARCISPWPEMNSFFRIEDGKILVDIDVRDKKGALVARVKNNEWAVSNEAFDRNFDEKHFEVFDKFENKPMLQIMFVDNVIILNGVFYDSNGTKYVYTAQGLYINPPGTINTTIPSWFQYPSGGHAGELNKESVEYSLQSLKEILNRMRH